MQRMTPSRAGIFLLRDQTGTWEADWRLLAVNIEKAVIQVPAAQPPSRPTVHYHACYR